MKAIKVSMESLNEITEKNKTLIQKVGVYSSERAKTKTGRGQLGVKEP